MSIKQGLSSDIFSIMGKYLGFKHESNAEHLCGLNVKTGFQQGKARLLYQIYDLYTNSLKMEAKDVKDLIACEFSLDRIKERKENNKDLIIEQIKLIEANKKIDKIFKQISNNLPDKSPMLGEISLDSFMTYEENMKRARLTLWKNLPGGNEYLENHPNIKNCQGLALRQELRKWIKENKSSFSNLKKLDFSSKKLTCVPPEIGLFTNLIALYLRENSIKTLPKSMEKLHKLEFLDLSENKLRRIPKWIGNLTELRTLSLSKNPLKEALPKSIGNLSQLEHLGLMFNMLEEIPESIENLRNLKHLYVGHNQLKAVPKWIENLHQLETLALGSNKLGKFPESIIRLTQLQILGLIDNGLEEIPKSIEKLHQLRTLAISDNSLKTLPKSIANLTQLKRLYIARNQLGETYVWLKNMNLEVLDF